MAREFAYGTRVQHKNFGWCGKYLGDGAVLWDGKPRALNCPTSKLRKEVV